MTVQIHLLIHHKALRTLPLLIWILVTPSPLNYSEGGAVKISSPTDWSRAARIKRTLEGIDDDIFQGRITDYFQAINEVQDLLRQNEQLKQNAPNLFN